MIDLIHKKQYTEFNIPRKIWNIASTTQVWFKLRIKQLKANILFSLDM